MKVSVQCFQWRVMSEEQFCHFCVSVERGPMERRSTVLAERIDRQTGREHQADGGEVIVPGGIGDLTGIRINHPRSEGGMGRQQSLHIGFIIQPASGEQFYIRRAAAHQ